METSPGAVSWADVLVAVTATVALVLSGYQLWLQHLRRPRLYLLRPSSFGITRSTAPGLILDIPVLFQNAGAKPALVTAIRLRVEEWPAIFRWTAELPNLSPDGSSREGRRVQAGALVPAHGGLQFVGEFQHRGTELPTPGPFTVVAEARVGLSSSWSVVGRFTLPMPDRSLADGYVSVAVDPWENAAQG